MIFWNSEFEKMNNFQLLIIQKLFDVEKNS